MMSRTLSPNASDRLERARTLIDEPLTLTRRPLRVAAAWGSAAAGFAALAACVVFVTAPGPAPAPSAPAAPSTARPAAPPLPAPVRVSAAPVTATHAFRRETAVDAGSSALEAEAIAHAAVTSSVTVEWSETWPEEAPGAPAAAPPDAPRSTSSAFASDAPKIAVVIDDLGLDPRAAERALALPGPVTLSVLPYAPDAARLAARAEAAGHEVFVHLPMEPEGLDDPGPQALTTWLSVEEIHARAAAAFDAVPSAVGFNNHMGSRFTSCGACVEPVAAAARARGFVALDSVTGEHTVLGRAASRAGLAVLARDIFVDHVRDPAAIAAALGEAERLAAETGSAVVIAHPHAATLEALEAWLPTLAARGLALVGAAELARARAS